MNKFWTILIGLSVWAASLYAGDTISTYSCDFEDVVQNATWHFPTNNEVSHQWTIGEAVNNGGQRAMYVTPKGQDTTAYVNRSSVVYAYVDLTLAKVDKNYKYYLSFDWMAAGFKENGIDALYVFWVPDHDDFGDSIYINDQNTSFIPNQLKAYALALNPGLQDSLCGKSTWQAWVSNSNSSSDSRLASAGKHRRLVFAWRNGNDGPVNPAACIDNIAIVDSRACGKPQALTITTAGEDSLVLDWKGEIQGYEVGCYSYEKDVWQVVRVDTTHYVFTDVPEGFTDFYVRTICWDTLKAEEYFSAKVQSSEFIYYPGNHCIDYITMSDDNCYSNTDDTKVSAVHDIDKVEWNKGMIDYGSESKDSRHTHHFSKIETDERTGGGLRTVPKGEIASTRLGNWNTGGEAERAEFKFHVDVKQNPILVMKYAVVLEHPNDGCKPNPGFRLRVLNNKQLVGNSCTALDFDYKAAADKDWNMYQPPSGRDIRWKDWTTVGVNLEDYDGKDLTIQLTTYDCGGGGHFGYAYFTLGCAKKELGGLRCDGKPSTDFLAPAGFKYRWYAKENPDSTVATTQDFHIDSLDSRIYNVDIISPEDSGCHFTLEAMSQPRYPVADFTYQHKPKNCRNYINIRNACRVETVYLKTNDTILSAPDSIRWDFGVGKGSQIPYGGNKDIEFPMEGGSFPVTVTSYFNDCENTTTIMVEVPAIGEQTTDTTVYRCPGDKYYFIGHNADGTEVRRTEPYTELGTYLDTLVAYTGCDSIIRTKLDILKPVGELVKAVILAGDSILFHDSIYKQTGIYIDTIKSEHGCDSIIDTLDLYRHEYLVVKMALHDEICADAGVWHIPFVFEQGRSCAEYSLTWDEIVPGLPLMNHAPLPADSTFHLTMPTDIDPDYYHAHFVFHDSLRYLKPEEIKDFEADVELGARYPGNDVIAQRWNDVLAIRNEDFNGGHIFTAVQWYMNGVPIVGATDFNYFAGEDGQLVFGQEYSALLTRDDGVKLFSCGYVPVAVPAEVINMPSLVPLGSQVTVPGAGMAAWYDLSGRKHSAQAYDNSAITAPSTAGYYLLELRSDTRRSIHQMMVK
jgi:hypothetical protein